MLDSARACQADRWHAGVYLGGYGLECTIKADLCDIVLRGARWTRASLEAAGMGDLWTHNLLVLADRAGYPSDVMASIRSISRSWNEHLRYEVPLIERPYAEPVHTLMVQTYVRLKELSV